VTRSMAQKTTTPKYTKNRLPEAGYRIQILQQRLNMLSVSGGRSLQQSDHLTSRSGGYWGSSLIVRIRLSK